MTNVIKPQTNGIKLLPCPFCGGEAELCVHEATGVSWIRCTECDASSGQTASNAAVMAWNTREERTQDAKCIEAWSVAVSTMAKTCSKENRHEAYEAAKELKQAMREALYGAEEDE